MTEINKAGISKFERPITEVLNTPKTYDVQSIIRYMQEDVNNGDIQKHESYFGSMAATRQNLGQWPTPEISQDDLAKLMSPIEMGRYEKWLKTQGKESN